MALSQDAFIGIFAAILAADVIVIAVACCGRASAVDAIAAVDGGRHRLTSSAIMSRWRRTGETAMVTASAEPRA